MPLSSCKNEGKKKRPLSSTIKFKISFHKEIPSFHRANSAQGVYFVPKNKHSNQYHSTMRGTLHSNTLSLFLLFETDK